VTDVDVRYIKAVNVVFDGDGQPMRAAYCNTHSWWNGRKYETEKLQKNAHISAHSIESVVGVCAEMAYRRHMRVQQLYDELVQMITGTLFYTLFYTLYHIFIAIAHSSPYQRSKGT
jgi:hypothetical protein